MTQLKDIMLLAYISKVSCTRFSTYTLLSTEQAKARPFDLQA